MRSGSGRRARNLSFSRFFEEFYKVVEDFEGLQMKYLMGSVQEGEFLTEMLKQKLEFETIIENFEKIIFVADKIEPERPQSTDEYRHRLFSLSLDEITYSVVQENIDYLEKRGKVVAPVSFMLRDELLESLKVEHSNLIHKV